MSGRHRGDGYPGRPGGDWEPGDPYGARDEHGSGGGGVWDSDAPLAGGRGEAGGYGSGYGANDYGTDPYDRRGAPPRATFQPGRDSRLSGPEQAQRPPGTGPYSRRTDFRGGNPGSGGYPASDPRYGAAREGGRRGQARYEDPQPRDPRQGDPRQGDPRQGDPRQGDPRQGDPRQGDPRQGDPRQGAPRQGAPRQADPRQADARRGDPWQGSPRQASSRQGDPWQDRPRRNEARYRDQGYGDQGYGDPQRPGQDAPWEGDGLLPGLDRRERGYPARHGEQGYYEDSHADDRYAGAGLADGRYAEEEEGQDGEARFDHGNRRGRKGRRRGPLRRLAPWIALIVILVPLIGGGLYVYRYVQNKSHPPDFTGAGTGAAVTVQVNNGDTPTSLGLKLYQLGVVKSQRAFILAADHSTSTATLEAGFFRMKHDMQASLAYAYLLNPKNMVKNTVTLPEGLRASDTLIRLGQSSGLPLTDYQAAIKQVAALGLPAYAGGKPEGYLFPSQYIIQPNDTALSVLKEMVARFKQHAAADGLPASANLPASGGTVHLTEGQLIIAASLVQAEGGRPQDFPQIAEVVYNRLKAGMPLHFDSTVLYGLGKYGTSATIAQTQTPGPYNTYLNKGLPPGPIANPGDTAIHAALHPATGNLLYFYGCPNGVTKFSATQPLTKASC